jgi:hypothetical protein
MKDVSDDSSWTYKHRNCIYRSVVVSDFGSMFLLFLLLGSGPYITYTFCNISWHLHRISLLFHTEISIILQFSNIIILYSDYVMYEPALVSTKSLILWVPGNSFTPLSKAEAHCSSPTIKIPWSLPLLLLLLLWHIDPLLGKDHETNECSRCYAKDEYIKGSFWATARWQRSRGNETHTIIVTMETGRFLCGPCREVKKKTTGANQFSCQSKVSLWRGD